jgi:hypothetical protein
VTALHEAILPRTPRVNVDRFDLVLSQPLLDGVRDELRAVVRSSSWYQKLREAMRRRMSNLWPGPDNVAMVGVVGAAGGVDDEDDG